LVLVFADMQNTGVGGYGGFHPDFKGKPGRPASVWQGQSPRIAEGAT
jgi:hypothetical protein